MIFPLFPFQENAVYRIRQNLVAASNEYASMGSQQVISLQAPTGSGKTIVMAALIESVFAGSGNIEPQPDAIFVWLSDSPELNEQSKRKIELKANRIRPGQCVTISDETFDMEEFENGHIYFLNTQKLARGSGLARHSDRRQFTLWETIENTINNRNKHLYFIIDEAHRGMRGREAVKAATIMQKFIKGDKTEDMEIAPMPVIIGMSATAERFNNLVGKLDNSTLRPVRINADEVRSSGLLKDKIVIVYPENEKRNDEMALLEEAAKVWKDKCDRWNNYCVGQHEAKFNPVFVIQVKNRSADQATRTDMSEILRRIREKTGIRLAENEAVHTFGNTGAIEANGISIEHIKPADIQDNHNVRVVFFKENLSTGWDCPRAEVMMSFRAANDATYVAQLLGRMVRAPKQRHIDTDESLNEVRLFLPYFNRESVKNVVDSLQQAEGDQLPVDVDSEEAGAESTMLTPDAPFNKKYFKKRQEVNVASTQNLLNVDKPDKQHLTQPAEEISSHANSGKPVDEKALSPSPDKTGISQSQTAHDNENNIANAEKALNEDENKILGRMDIVKFVNNSRFKNYKIRKARINSYLKSLCHLVSLLRRHNVYQKEAEEAKKALLEKMNSFILGIEESGEYDTLARDIMNIKFEASIFDALGNELEKSEQLLLLISSASDIDYQLGCAESKLERLGLVTDYIKNFKHERDIEKCKLDCILYVSEKRNIDNINEFAKEKFHFLGDLARRALGNDDEYKKIMADSDTVSVFNLELPECAIESPGKDGDIYFNHLYANSKGEAKIYLNTWEKAIVETESQNANLICWLRNFDRKSWALCLEYEKDGHASSFYPDFLMFRQENNEIIMDVIEPHRRDQSDSLAKIKAMAKYAIDEPALGRILFIREKPEGKQLQYLDMTKKEIRERISKTNSNEALDDVFVAYGQDYAAL